MPDGGVIWFDLVGLSPRGSEMCSFSVNHLSFLNQLPHGLAVGGITNIVTHIVCTYNIIIIFVFLLVIEMQMCSRVIFGPAEDHVFDPNSAASRALGLNSLLPYSLALYYLAQKYQPRVAFASMRT